MLAGLILVPLSAAGTAGELRYGVSSPQTPSGPTPTIEPVASRLPTIVLGQDVTPTAPPSPLAVNDLPIAAFIVMTDAIRLNARAIFLAGRQLGNDTRAFSAIGDSTISGGLFLERFGAGKYDLGDYAFLQAVIDEFAPSFKRTSVSVRVGQHAWTILNPMWADKKRCVAGESPVDCDVLAATLPGRGLGRDGVHMTPFYANDYRLPRRSRAATACTTWPRSSRWMQYGTS